jgi:hypothetical protein
MFQKVSAFIFKIGHSERKTRKSGVMRTAAMIIKIRISGVFYETISLEKILSCLHSIFLICAYFFSSSFWCSSTAASYAAFSLFQLPLLPVFAVSPFSFRQSFAGVLKALTEENVHQYPVNGRDREYR